VPKNYYGESAHINTRRGVSKSTGCAQSIQTTHPKIQAFTQQLVVSCQRRGVWSKEMYGSAKQKLAENPTKISEIRCYRCGKKVRDGGVGDFNLELKYVTFCSPECRSLFWQKDKGLHKPIQKQESLWVFAIPQFDEQELM
jgi:hypothetical protein